MYSIGVVAVCLLTVGVLGRKGVLQNGLLGLAFVFLPCEEPCPVCMQEACSQQLLHRNLSSRTAAIPTRTAPVAH